ncbi:LysM peptidoglycan-binding domain-containing protein [Pelagibius sp. Alg239-R121]|uniref:LysM peptidoglycan-binding domain-containing protein n=1 Tax=Pelagibius sp. Alg239-R121 TaxID=2993448 RepID=UPI0024A77BB7|nr:LysM peptidoglycan-binding domain-containing protein [Pelagibius sp. Alg239-R121]
MRSLGLVAAVVVVIFAAAFGVYYWLGGSTESDVQVASPAVPAAETSSSGEASSSESSSNEPSSSAANDEAPAIDTTANGSAPAAPAVNDQQAANQANPEQLKSKSTSSSAVPADQQASRTESAASGSKTSSTAAGSGTSDQSAGSQSNETSAIKQPKQPQVVARVKEPLSTESAPEKPAGPVPSFDVVRVEKTGEAILAGRAPAGSEVTIYDGDTPLGIVTADSRGQWVLILDVPLRPGSHSLGITARQADQPVVESDNLVIVAVPEPQVETGSGTSVAQSDVAGTQPDVSGNAASGNDTGPEANLSGSDAALTSAEGVKPSGGEDASSQIAAVQPPVVDDDPVASGTAKDTVTPGAVDADDDTEENPVAPSQIATAEVEVKEPIAVIVPRSGTGPTRILQQPELTGEGIGNGSLFLDSVDYDDEGRAVIGGRATPGAALIIYLDNLPVGEALTDDAGRWAMTPEDLVPIGLHKLRVDQIENTGRVTARVESPFSRADTVESHPDENFVTVQPGNSLWRIARATYGQGTRYTVIYETNKEQIRDPDLIYPGQIFRVPSGG